MGWVWLVSPANGLPHKVTDDESVLAFHVGRDYQVTDIPGDLNQDDEEFKLEWAKLQAGEQNAELRGKALDEALKAAGLSTAGTVDEKRARLTEYEAASNISEAPATEQEEEDK